MEIETIIFDQRKYKKFGVHFNGQIEDANTKDLIAYLDFMTPSNIYKKLNDAMKAEFEELICVMENHNLTGFVSGLKDAATKKFIEHSIAILFVENDEPTIANIHYKRHGSSELFLSQPNADKKRYVAFGEINFAK